MRNKFQVADPRGILVTCKSKQWDAHIVQSHPEMSLKAVKSAVLDPDLIFGSDRHDDRDVYFQACGTDIYTKVIVRIFNNKGSVITAFRQKGVRGNINQGDVKHDKSKLS